MEAKRKQEEEERKKREDDEKRIQVCTQGSQTEFLLNSLQNYKTEDQLLDKLSLIYPREHRRFQKWLWERTLELGK